MRVPSADRQHGNAGPRRRSEKASRAAKALSERADAAVVLVEARGQLVRLQPPLKHVIHFPVVGPVQGFQHVQGRILDRLKPGRRPAEHRRRAAQDQRGLADLDRAVQLHR